MRVNAVLAEEISSEGQVCSKIDFSEKCPRQRHLSLGFTKGEREKSQIISENNNNNPSFRNM